MQRAQRSLPALLRLLFLIILLSLPSVGAWATITAPGITDNENNLLDATWDGQGTLFTSDNSALTVGGDAGPRNFRADLTFGILLDNAERNRVKFTGEYLWQDIDYSFFTGVTRQWVDQGAVGADYQYYVGSFLDHLDFSGYYSHAPSQDLDPITGNFINANGLFTNYIDFRRIAGSNAGGFSPGVTVQPWHGAQVGVGLNYDDVVYNTQFQNDENARGFGGTASFSQALGNHLSANILGSVRQPFNNYQAGLSWLQNSSMGAFTLGLFGGYTEGKSLLPSTSIVGVNMSYVANQPSNNSTNQLNYNGQETNVQTWAAQPAVRMPQVLAIPDERVVLQTQTPNTPPPPPPPCRAPTFSGTIPDQSVVQDDDITPIDSANFFTPSSGLTYTLIGATPGTVSIDPTTGVISGNVQMSILDFPLTVQASNACGTATSNVFTITIIPMSQIPIFHHQN